MVRRLRSVVLIVAVTLWVLTLMLMALSYLTLDMVSWTSAAHRHIELLTIPGQVRATIVGNWPTGREPMQYRSSIPSGQFVIFGQRPIYEKWFLPGIGVTNGAARVSDPSAKPVVVAFRTIAVPFELPLLAL